MSDRAHFLAMVLNAPILGADAIVVLAGQDAAPRASVAWGLFTRGVAAAMLVTGRATTLREHESADDVMVRILAHGLAPDRITLDRKSDNTREQAVRMVAEAQARGWRRILLVASAYHIPRAMLTFVQAIDEAHADLRVVPVAAGPAIADAPWTGVPERMTQTRLALLSRELEKCEAYTEHVASFARGVAYLQDWERE